MTVTPISGMRQGMPEQGRIRLGKKGNRGAPMKLHTFRFTSHDETAIREIARLYGGVAAPWTDGPRVGEWEVETTTSRVPILLPPNPLGEGTALETPIYEMWSRGGLQRRCDGELCLVSNGDDLVEMPCLCDAAGHMECKPKTRLTVILREIPFGGGWRIETGGYTAARELPGMVKMLLSLQGRGISAGYLILREEKAVKNGKTMKFVVPMLTTDGTPDELVAGAGMVQSLGTAPTVAIEAPEHSVGLGWVEGVGPAVIIDADDEIHDAEIVEEAGPDASARHPSSVSSTSKIKPWEVAFYQAMGDLAKLPEVTGIPADDVRHIVCHIVSKGATRSSKELDEAAMKVATALALDVLAGERRLIRADDDVDFAFSARRPEGTR